VSDRRRQKRTNFFTSPAALFVGSGTKIHAMKLIRFGEPGSEKPGVLINEKRYDVSEAVNDYDEHFFGNNGITSLKEFINNNHDRLKPVSDDVRLGPPLARPSKLICIGLNYIDHAKETGAAPPAEPIIFFKATTAICGPNDDLIIPKSSKKTDWEVELAVVIGKKASYVDEAEAGAHVAGYCLHNDYSERAFQLERGGQWVKGKSCDTFAPLGPYITLAEDIADVNNLRLWLTVNGRRVQDGTTANLIFNIPFLVHYISQFMTLLPGDVISTGTPHGVGLGMKPEPIFIKPGDVIELGIDGLGTSRQVSRAWK
jgi:2,4-didehydro-3-deoxy-L-rhamnonate hydrolase